jgi:hypothetical protein
MHQKYPDLRGHWNSITDAYNLIGSEQARSHFVVLAEIGSAARPSPRDIELWKLWLAELVLPKGFPRIRYFGFLANRRRAESLPRCRALLTPVPRVPPTDSVTAPDLWRCPCCQGPMRLVERLTPAQILRLETRPVYAIDSS